MNALHLRASRFIIAPCLLLFLLLLGALGRDAVAAQGAELYRIRVTNTAGGAVEVSGDGGASFYRVGKVLRPATSLIPGFAASRWAPPGSVAATAVHGIRIKARNAQAGDPKSDSSAMMLSLVPREFQKLPKDYGGHRPGTSGIYTDISCGDSIFRNLAPLVGSLARLELADRLASFPEGYRPRPGDRIVILVLPPPVMPREIVFENWKGGAVTAVFDGQDPQPIARVQRPVLGVGRYDATSYTGVGHINTNHCGVITVSTAGISGSLLTEGEGSERRGGFQIEPSTHAKAVSFGAPQVLVVEPLVGQGSLEGRPPLFSGYFGLYWDPRSPEASLTAEVKIDNGAWEPMPEMLGRLDNAFTAPVLNQYFRKRGVVRHITSGVTHLRFVFPRLDRAVVARFLECFPASTAPAGAAGGTAAAPVPAATRVRGVVTLNVEMKNIRDLHQINIMTVYVDGRVQAIMNVAPFRHELDTRQLANGRHEVEMRALDGQGGVVAEKKTVILVDNPEPVSG